MQNRRESSGTSDTQQLREHSWIREALSENNIQVNLELIPNPHLADILAQSEMLLYADPNRHDSASEEIQILVLEVLRQELDGVDEDSTEEDVNKALAEFLISADNIANLSKLLGEFQGVRINRYQLSRFIFQRLILPFSSPSLEETGLSNLQVQVFQETINVVGMLVGNPKYIGLAAEYSGEEHSYSDLVIIRIKLPSDPTHDSPIGGNILEVRKKYFSDGNFEKARGIAYLRSVMEGLFPNPSIMSSKEKEIILALIDSSIKEQPGLNSTDKLLAILVNNAYRMRSKDEISAFLGELIPKSKRNLTSENQLQHLVASLLGEEKLDDDVSETIKVSLRKSLDIKNPVQPTGIYAVGLDKVTTSKSREFTVSHKEDFEKDLDRLVKGPYPEEDAVLWIFKETVSPIPSLEESAKAFRDRKLYLQFFSDNMTPEQWVSYGDSIVKINRKLDEALHIIILSDFQESQEQQLNGSRGFKYLDEFDLPEDDRDSLIFYMSSLPDEVYLAVVEIIPWLKAEISLEIKKHMDSLDKLEENGTKQLKDARIAKKIQLRMEGYLNASPANIDAAEIEISKLEEIIKRYQGDKSEKIIEIWSHIVILNREEHTYSLDKHKNIPVERWEEVSLRFAKIQQEAIAVNSDLEEMIQKSEEFGNMNDVIESKRWGIINDVRGLGVAMRTYRTPLLEVGFVDELEPDELERTEEYVRGQLLNNIVGSSADQGVSDVGKIMILLQHATEWTGEGLNFYDIMNILVSDIPQSEGLEFVRELGLDYFRQLVVHTLFSILNKDIGDPVHSKVSPFQAELLEASLGYRILKGNVSNEVPGILPINPNIVPQRREKSFFERLRNKEAPTLEDEILDRRLSLIGEMRLASSEQGYADSSYQGWLGTEITTSELTATSPPGGLETIAKNYQERIMLIAELIEEADENGGTSEIIPEVVTKDELIIGKEELQRAMAFVVHSIILPKYGLENALSRNQVMQLFTEEGGHTLESVRINIAVPLMRSIDVDWYPPMKAVGFVGLPGDSEEDNVLARKNIKRLLMLSPAIQLESRNIFKRETQEAKKFADVAVLISKRADTFIKTNEEQLERLKQILESKDLNLLEIEEILLTFPDKTIPFEENSAVQKRNNTDRLEDHFQRLLAQLDDILLESESGEELRRGKAGEWVWASGDEKNLLGSFSRAASRVRANKEKLQRIVDLRTNYDIQVLGDGQYEPPQNRLVNHHDLESMIGNKIHKAIQNISDPKLRKGVIVYFRQAYPEHKIMKKDPRFAFVTETSLYGTSINFKSPERFEAVKKSYDDMSALITSLDDVMGLGVPEKVKIDLRKKFETDTKNVLELGIGELYGLEANFKSPEGFENMRKAHDSMLTLIEGLDNLNGTDIKFDLREQLERHTRRIVIIGVEGLLLSPDPDSPIEGYKAVISDQLRTSGKVQGDSVVTVMSATLEYLNSRALYPRNEEENPQEKLHRIRLKNFLYEHFRIDGMETQPIEVWVADKGSRGMALMQNPTLIDTAQENNKRGPAAKFFKTFDSNDGLAGVTEISMRMDQHISEGRYLDIIRKGNLLDSRLRQVAVNVGAYANLDRVESVEIENVIKAIIKLLKEEQNKMAGLTFSQRDSARKEWLMVQEWFGKEGIVPLGVDLGERSGNLVSQWESELERAYQLSKNATDIAISEIRPSENDKIRAEKLVGPFGGKRLEAVARGSTIVGGVIPFSKVEPPVVVEDNGVPIIEIRSIDNSGLSVRVANKEEKDENGKRVIVENQVFGNISTRELEDGIVMVESSEYIVYVRSTNIKVTNIRSRTKDFLSRLIPDRYVSSTDDKEIGYEIMTFKKDKTVGDIKNL